ncbi:MAG TPA: helix-turn-helix transcriptional regulator [Pyrinomonadaceae bacterium]|nr:helix-turn-helix transcriptional regulator [Pyrinomonadaceae bacterium]
MGRASKRKPDRLAEKLLQIRTALGLSQNEMIRRLGLSDELLQASISGYELGTRIPPLTILLLYAEVAGVCTDVLINDNLDLPARLPSKPKHKH